MKNNKQLNTLKLLTHLEIKQLYKQFWSFFPRAKIFKLEIMVHYVKNYLWISSLFLQSCTKTKCHYNVISCLHSHSTNNRYINCICLFWIIECYCKYCLLRVVIHLSENCLKVYNLVKSTHLIRLWFELQLTRQSAVLFTPENCLMSSIKIKPRVPKNKVCVMKQLFIVKCGPTKILITSITWSFGYNG